MVMKKKTRKLVGNTFMVMFSDNLQTYHCFVPSCSRSKDTDLENLGKDVIHHS
ncbi:hypothetical protein RchiOBHm_Chr5g0032451 [Rosa chinensis]|uniref:Uncharacterized protein n=1 Tax=Rosa chinensis TaxID=74649 RepID=A0A2P6QAH9_ROSCH|nr:hypothetical protein RchiOBHm_Chr5g0032451 [Rosa chinensis]